MAEATGPPWWREYDQVLTDEGFATFLDYEASATHLHQFHPTIVPGLLQTEAYMRALIPAVALSTRPAGHTEALVQLRLRRQREVWQRSDAPQFLAVVDEGALRTSVGGTATMRAQLDRLIESIVDGVAIGILPLGGAPHPGLQGAFHLITTPAGSAVFLETASGHTAHTDPALVTGYRDQLGRLAASSLRREDAVRRIRSILGEW